VTTLLLVSLAAAQANYALMREVAAARYGVDTVAMVDDWRIEIQAMRDLPDSDKLILANRFFNARIRWEQDPNIWNQVDYWATPLEVMGRRMGDCEDFAIAKYTTLVLAGMDIEKLRITYVKASLPGNAGLANQAHMVLAYYATATAEPVILDNLIEDIYPASKRTDLTPVYGFNSKGIWVGGAANPASTQPAEKLSRWRDLLRRAAEEGLG